MNDFKTHAAITEIQRRHGLVGKRTYSLRQMRDLLQFRTDEIIILRKRIEELERYLCL